MTTTATVLDRWTVNVKRFPTLSLYFEEGNLRRCRPLEVGIAISCPAPENGLPVTLLSSDPAKVESGHVVIPSGENRAAVSLEVGAQAGQVELTGLAPGYLRDSVHAVITTTASQPD